MGTDETRTSTATNYNDWDKYAAETASAAEKEDENEKNRQRDEAFRSNFGNSGRGRGYTFRKGHETMFPEIELQANEADQEAAWRVAGELRTKGKTALEDGSVVGAQGAVDFWGQGILALERLKNLRKYQPQTQQSEADVAKILDSPEFWQGYADQGGTPYPKAEDPVQMEGPSNDEVSSLQCLLRLNIAQALLKLRDFETCINNCEAVLELEPRNTKALWRKAKAVWGTRNPGMARDSLGRLLEVDSANAAATQLLREIEFEEARLKAKRNGQRVSAPRTGKWLLPSVRNSTFSTDAGLAKSENGEIAHTEPIEQLMREERCEATVAASSSTDGHSTGHAWLWCCRRKMKMA